MINFYRKTLVSSLLMLLVSGLCASVIYHFSYFSDNIFPKNTSPFPWKFEAYTDADQGGNSSINVLNSDQQLRFTFKIGDSSSYPSTTAVIDFFKYNKKSVKNWIDLSPYKSISFNARCEKLMTLTFQLHNFDEKITKEEIFTSYRIAQQSFICKEKETRITIDLTRLSVPVWWFDQHQISVTDNTYALQFVRALSFFIQENTPSPSSLEVSISDLHLHGHNHIILWLGGSTLVVLWAAYLISLFRSYNQHLITAIKARIAKNKPYIAYQKLSLNPHKDKIKSDLLHLMTEEYCNPDMSLKFTVDKLGLNRNKINALLKEEIGLTFTAYLNQLRLNEVADQIIKNRDKNISDIAHSVGYNNISYFNRIFKAEYGFTPRKFREVYQEKPEAHAEIL